MDQAKIHELHLRYFRGIGHGDKAEVRSCFTDNVNVTCHGQRPVAGIDDFINHVPGPFFQRVGNPHSKPAYHLVGHMNVIQLDDQYAQTELYAVSTRVEEGKAPEQASMRGLRYLDKLRRNDGKWRICERIQALDWAASGPAAYSTTLAQRIQALSPPQQVRLGNPAN